MRPERPGFTLRDLVPLNVWSASVPMRWQVDEDGLAFPVRAEGVRPWNGRLLAAAEIDGCFKAFYREWDRSQRLGYAAQAAYEFLSETCW